MKKKLLTLLLSIAVILTSTVTVFAESEVDTFTFDGINYKITSIGDTNTVEVSSNSSYSGNTVTIPETVTRLIVNENGVEASAYTRMAEITGSIFLDTPEEINFHLDRPFMFSIVKDVDDENVPLFVGSVVDPIVN